MIDAYARRRRDDERLGVTAAWYGAAFERQKRLPNIDALFEPAPLRNTPAYHRAKAEELKAVLQSFPRAN